jgi:uncharacterized membrane protein YoaK (UPF0700 family)
VVPLLVVLAGASGCLDVVCVTRLGGLFASVITGNLVQFGHAVVATDARMAVGGVTAVGGYAVGVAGGTMPLRRVGSAGAAVPEWSWRLRRRCSLVSPWAG